MDFIYKLEKYNGHEFKYEIFFVDKGQALKWIRENHEQGFFPSSIKEIELNEKLIRRNI